MYLSSRSKAACVFMEMASQRCSFSVVNDTLKLSEKMPFADMAAQISKTPAHIPAGTTLLNKPTKPTKLTLAPGADGKSFVVIFSMSHTLGNGGTYFTLLNMLSAGTEVFACNVDRKEDLCKKAPDIIGKQHFAKHLALSSILNGLGAFIRMKCCCKKVKLHCFNVDDAALGKAIAAAKALPDAPAKITTNDILTSGYGQAVRPRLLTMAIDFHGKIDGLEPNDVGNYHSGTIYDRNGYATPAAIRNSLSGPPPLSRATLPGCCAGSFCKTGVITNWASMTKGDFCIPDCQLLVSLPYVNAAMVPTNCCIVFKSAPGKTSLMIFAKGVPVSEFMAKLPLGESMSADMFPAS